MSSSARVVHSSSKQIISHRGQNENGCDMHKNDNRTCKACKSHYYTQICEVLVAAAFVVTREFKKLQRQLQRKRHIKIDLCVKLSLLRLFHVDHVVQNTRIVLSLAWYERFSCKGKEWKIYCYERCRQHLNYENFTSSFSRLRQNIAPKSVPHVQHDYFSSFNQSNHWFVALSLTLPSPNLKFPITSCSGLASFTIRHIVNNFKTSTPLFPDFAF